MSSRKNRRGLTPEDREIWDTVARTVKRTKPVSHQNVTAAPSAPPKPKVRVKNPVNPQFDIKPTIRPLTSAAVFPDVSEALRQATPNMDRKNYDRLRKGKLQPERRVDLHGMTADVAHGVLTRFILSAHAAGARTVLVITGKGRTSRDDNTVIPVRRGVIRNSVPDWLRQPPLSGKVVQVIPAHRRHGGDGAYYVYLKRDRSG